MIREFQELREIEEARSNAILVVVSEEPHVSARFRFRFGQTIKPNMGVGAHGRLRDLIRKLVDELSSIKPQEGFFVISLIREPEPAEGQRLSDDDFAKVKQALAARFDR